MRRPMVIGAFICWLATAGLAATEWEYQAAPGGMPADRVGDVLPDLPPAISADELLQGCAIMNSSREQVRAALLFHAAYIGSWRELVESQNAKDYLARTIDVSRMPLHRPDDASFARWLSGKRTLEASIRVMQEALVENVTSTLSPQQQIAWQHCISTARRRETPDRLVQQLLPGGRIIDLDWIIGSAAIAISEPGPVAGVLADYRRALDANVRALADQVVKLRQRWQEATRDVVALGANQDEKSVRKKFIAAWMDAATEARAEADKYQQLNLTTVQNLQSLLDQWDGCILSAEVRAAMYGSNFQDAANLARCLRAASRSAPPEKSEALSALLREWEKERNRLWPSIVAGFEARLRRHVLGVPGMVSGPPAHEDEMLVLRQSENSRLQRRMWDDLRGILGDEAFHDIRSTALAHLAPGALGPTSNEDRQATAPDITNLRFPPMTLTKFVDSMLGNINGGNELCAQCEQRLREAELEAAAANRCLAVLQERATQFPFPWPEMQQFADEGCAARMLQAIALGWAADDECLCWRGEPPAPYKLAEMRLERQSAWHSPIADRFKTREAYVSWAWIARQCALQPRGLQQLREVLSSRAQHLLNASRAAFLAESRLWYAETVAQAWLRAQIIMNPDEQAAAGIGHPGEQSKLLASARDEAAGRVRGMRLEVSRARDAAIELNQSVLAELRSTLAPSECADVEMAYRKESFVEPMQWFASTIALAGALQGGSPAVELKDVRDALGDINGLLERWIQLDTASDRLLMDGGESAETSRIALNARRALMLLEKSHIAAVLKAVEPQEE